ncbi:MAG: methyltransferase domain-containing protein [Planctomycetes bacterium]|nr:methyltransferase domain-containing protein [Planctomycetota bacterium]
MYTDFCQRFVDGKAGRLLDVGCGLGFFLEKVSGFPQWDAFGCEVSRPAVEFARTKLGLANIICGRIEKTDLPEGSFDIITLWDVIEHIPQPDQFLSCLMPLLKDDGFLFAHTPNIRIQLPKAKLKKLLSGSNRRLHYLEARDHANIYSRTTLATVLERNGLPHVRFIHLRPISGIAGNSRWLLRGIKNAWFHSAILLDRATFGRLSIDNLFVIAKRRAF